jgi:hypothetical protein
LYQAIDEYHREPCGTDRSLRRTATNSPHTSLADQPINNVRNSTRRLHAMAHDRERGWTIGERSTSSASLRIINTSRESIDPRPGTEQATSTSSTTTIEQHASEHHSTSSSSLAHGSDSRLLDLQASSAKWDHTKVIGRGWLVKQGGSIKTWHRRFFVLDGYSLTYFANDSVCDSNATATATTLEPSSGVFNTSIIKSNALNFKF